MRRLPRAFDISLHRTHAAAAEMLVESLSTVSLPQGAVASPLISATLVATLLVMLVAYLYRSAYDRPENFPPGPPRLPFWGSYWLVLLLDYKFLHRGLATLAKRYKSSVVGFFLGNFPCVVLTDYAEIKEVLSRPEFAGRPDVIVARERSLGGREGVIFGDGPEWQEVRRFMLRHIRDYGWGRRMASAEAIMEEEVKDCVDLLRGEWHDHEAMRPGGRVMTSQLAAPFVFNVMWHMFGGMRIPREEHPAMRRVLRNVSRFFRAIDSHGTAVSMTPWLRFTPKRWNLDEVEDSSEPLRQFVRKSVAEHKTTHQDDNPRDFIDRFLAFMKEKGEEKPGVFSDKQLLMTGVDMVTASVGGLTSGTAFMWQQLLHYPEVQAKVQEEVDRVVGRGRLATLDDRQHMPYTEATVRETLRRVMVAPIMLPHTAMEDTTLAGYNIPKGTILYPHMEAFHMSDELGEDPQGFHPERFLEADGSLKKKDLTLPFGHGKRLCPGETFSRHMMFLLLSNILQSFTLRPDGVPVPEDAMHPGFVPVPVDVWAVVEPRP